MFTRTLLLSCIVLLAACAPATELPAPTNTQAPLPTDTPTITLALTYTFTAPETPTITDTSILLIALDNALKHSSGDVNVIAKKQGSQVEIRVQDFGEGISPEKLEHVFDRFYRGDETPTIPGFGLGLSIAKTLVERLDGQIKMESELGRGSVVVIQFVSAM